MRGAVDPFGQLFLAFLDRAIQPQDDIISDFPPFDKDGAEGGRIDSGSDDFFISFSYFFRPFLLFSLPSLFLLFSWARLFCLSFLSFLP
jgi:hypothetical protein